jgi:hypothetical protein
LYDICDFCGLVDRLLLCDLAIDQAEKNPHREPQEPVHKNINPINKSIRTATVPSPSSVAAFSSWLLSLWHTPCPKQTSPTLADEMTLVEYLYIALLPPQDVLFLR